MLRKHAAAVAFSAAVRFLLQTKIFTFPTSEEEILFLFRLCKVEDKKILRQ